MNDGTTNDGTANGDTANGDITNGDITNDGTTNGDTANGDTMAPGNDMSRPGQGSGQPRRLIVAMTGASGAILGVRLLQVLRPLPVHTHLVMSRWAQQTIAHETGTSAEAVRALADTVHPPGDMAATIASGSFRTDGMAVIPCSTASLGAIAQGTASHLIHRAADVVLKEGRRLVLVVREMPLSAIHLENMLRLARLGVVIMPPVPAFYSRPGSVADVVDGILARILDQFGIVTDLASPWNGDMQGPAR